MTLTRLFSLVLALDVLGLLVSGDGLGHALVVGSPINAPFTFVAVQAVIVLAATRHRAGAAVLALLSVISVLSGATDGSYAADLAAGERLIQLGIVTATALLGAAALRAAVRPKVLAVG